MMLMARCVTAVLSKRKHSVRERTEEEDGCIVEQERLPGRDQRATKWTLIFSKPLQCSLKMWISPIFRDNLLSKGPPRLTTYFSLPLSGHPQIVDWDLVIPSRAPLEGGPNWEVFVESLLKEDNQTVGKEKKELEKVNAGVFGEDNVTVKAVMATSLNHDSTVSISIELELDFCAQTGFPEGLEIITSLNDAYDEMCDRITFQGKRKEEEDGCSVEQERLETNYWGQDQRVTKWTLVFSNPLQCSLTMWISPIFCDDLLSKGPPRLTTRFCLPTKFLSGRPQIVDWDLVIPEASAFLSPTRLTLDINPLILLSCVLPTKHDLLHREKEFEMNSIPTSNHFRLLKNVTNRFWEPSSPFQEFLVQLGSVHVVVRKQPTIMFSSLAKEIYSQAFTFLEKNSDALEDFLQKTTALPGVENQEKDDLVKKLVEEMRKKQEDEFMVTQIAGDVEDKGAGKVRITSFWELENRGSDYKVSLKLPSSNTSSGFLSFDNLGFSPFDIEEWTNETRESPTLAFCNAEKIVQTYIENHLDHFKQNSPGVTGVGVSYKTIKGIMNLSIICLVVYVEKKQEVPPSERIPAKIHGLPTDIREGMAVIQSRQIDDSSEVAAKDAEVDAHAKEADAKVDAKVDAKEQSIQLPQIDQGIAIVARCANNSYVGTIGTDYYRDGKRYLLTCGHVVLPEHDFFEPPEDENINRHKKIEMKIAQRTLNENCDVAELESEIQIPAGGNWAGVGRPRLRDKVQKWGATTSWTTGQVVSQLQFVTVDFLEWDLDTNKMVRRTKVFSNVY